MSKLTFEDIERIVEEVEEQKIECLRHICNKLNLLSPQIEQYYWEAYMESEHGDWGDRD